jgi:hypothetical protein
MAGFYVATGMVCLLLIGFYFAWTPLRVFYWEREVRKAPKVPSPGYAADTRVPATEKLAAVGPHALPAFKRLLSGGHAVALAGLRQPNDRWALPLIAQAVRSSDSVMVVQAAYAAERMSGRTFIRESDWNVERGQVLGLRGQLVRSLSKKSLEEIAARVLAWCEEGR